MCFFTLLPNPTFQTGNDPLLLFRFFSISMIYIHIWKLERTYEVFWIFVCFFYLCYLVQYDFFYFYQYSCRDHQFTFLYSSSSIPQCLFIIFSSNERNLGCFLFLVIENRLEINMTEQISVEDDVISFEPSARKWYSQVILRKLIFSSFSILHTNFQSIQTHLQFQKQK